MREGPTEQVPDSVKTRFKQFGQRARDKQDWQRARVEALRILVQKPVPSRQYASMQAFVRDADELATWIVIGRLEAPRQPEV